MKGTDSLVKLYQRLGSDPKGASAINGLLDSAESTQEGRGPTEQLRRLIDQRVGVVMIQPEQPEQAGQPAQAAPRKGELTESEQSQQAQEQAEAGEEGEEN